MTSLPTAQLNNMLTLAAHIMETEKMIADLKYRIAYDNVSCGAETTATMKRLRHVLGQARLAMAEQGQETISTFRDECDRQRDYWQNMSGAAYQPSKLFDIEHI